MSSSTDSYLNLLLVMSCTLLITLRVPCLLMKTNACLTEAREISLHCCNFSRIENRRS